MNAILVNLVLLGVGSGSGEALDQRTVVTKPQPLPKIGQIFIIGNERTKQAVILEQVGMYPGETINYTEMRLAEKKLARLGIFKVTPDGAVRPMIEVIDVPQNPDSVYKDVIIKIEETDTSRISFKNSFNTKGDWEFHVVVEERNFDPFYFPTSIEVIKQGRAFRGGGWAVGVNFQFKIPVRPLGRPNVSLTAMIPFTPWRFPPMN